jgi:hypothetical protein
LVGHIRNVLKNNRFHEASAGNPYVYCEKLQYGKVSTIAFGRDADEALLQRIASATHNGRFVSVDTLRELTDALIAHDPGRRQRYHHRSETAVFCLDLSGSMLQSARDGRRKIDAVEESVLRLLTYKQKTFA